MNGLQERVAEVISELEQDEGFREALADALPIREVLQEGARDPESPIHKAIARSISAALEGGEVLDSEMLSNAIAARDWRQILPEVLGSDTVRDAVAEAIKADLENKIEDRADLPFAEELTRLLEDSNLIKAIFTGEKVQESLRSAVTSYLEELDLTEDDVGLKIVEIAFGEEALKTFVESSPEVRTAVQKAVTDYIDEIDVSADEDIVETIVRTAFDEEGVRRIVTANRSAIDTQIAAAIPAAVERALENDEVVTTVVRTALGDSASLKHQIERAVEAALRGDLIQQTVTRILTRRLEGLLD